MFKHIKPRKAFRQEKFDSSLFSADNWRSGFRQKAALFNFQVFAALSRVAATIDGMICRGLRWDWETK
jgi:hypothetical protein